MSHSPQIALSVVTYQRPASLALVLESIAAQRGVEGEVELVVTDDGSTDHTAQVVEAFRRRANFPVTFVTHPRIGFRVARCRNEGAAVTTAPYLLFLDGDCVLPPQHVATHLAQRRPGMALAGDVCRLDQAASKRVTEETIRRGDFSDLNCAKELRRLRLLDLKYRLYSFLHHPTKPRSLRSGDFGIWRSDYLRVNGFDENFCGWGGEDDDLGHRLRHTGVRLKSFLRWTHSYHLWHPTDVTMPSCPNDAPNAKYLWRKGRLTCCRNGLVKRSWNDLAVRIVGQSTRPQEVQRMIAGRIGLPRCDNDSHRADSGNQALTAISRPEVEFLFLPGNGEFSGTADCNVLVALEDSLQARQLAQRAHLVVAPQALAETPDILQFRLDQWDQALETVA